MPRTILTLLTVALAALCVLAVPGLSPAAASGIGMMFAAVVMFVTPGGAVLGAFVAWSGHALGERDLLWAGIGISLVCLAAWAAASLWIAS